MYSICYFPSLPHYTCSNTDNCAVAPWESVGQDILTRMVGPSIDSHLFLFFSCGSS